MNLLVPNGFEANFTLGFAKGLAANNVDLLVLSCDLTEARLTAAGIPNLNIRGDLSENRSLARKVSDLLSYYARSARQFIAHRGGTIHFTGILDDRRIVLESLALLFLPKLLARRFLYTVHNVLPHGRRGSRFFKAIYRLLYRVPDLLLVHSESVRRQLVDDFGVPPTKICLTSIGLNEEVPFTAITRTEARAELGFGEIEKLVLFFGKIEEYKGPDLLVDAFEKLAVSNIHLIFAGSFGEASFRQSLLEQIERTPVRARIHLFEEFLANSRVEIFLKACDVLCLPYRNIYQSGVIFLAPRFGLPMILTDVGSLRDFVSPELGVFARTNDAAGIRDALEAFFAAPRMLDREEAMRHAEKFAWPRVCEGLVDLYDTAPSSRVSNAKLGVATLA